MDETIKRDLQLPVAVGGNESATLAEQGGQRQTHTRQSPPPFVLSSPDMRIIYLAPTFTLALGLAGLVFALDSVQSINKSIDVWQNTQSRNPYHAYRPEVVQRNVWREMHDRSDAYLALAVFAVQIATALTGMLGMYLRRAGGYMVYILGTMASSVACTAFAMDEFKGFRVHTHGLWIVAIGCNLMLLHPVVMEWYELAVAKRKTTVTDEKPCGKGSEDGSGMQVVADCA